MPNDRCDGERHTEDDIARAEEVKDRIACGPRDLEYADRYEADCHKVVGVRLETQLAGRNLGR